MSNQEKPNNPPVATGRSGGGFPAPPDGLVKTVVVLGPTATGKTRLGVELARRCRGEVLSADSRQVYRGMDIGTGKDLSEYGQGASRVACHLVDLIEPCEEFSLFRYLSRFWTVLADLQQRSRLPVVVGGSPLYLKAVLENYELPGLPVRKCFHQSLAACSDSELRRRLREQAPDLFARTDLTQRRRIVRALEIADSRLRCQRSPSESGRRLEALLVAPFFTRAEVHARIEQRLNQRLRQGLVEEVEGLHRAGVSWERLEFFGLEYRCASELLQGRIDQAGFRRKLLTRIRRFAKSQDCWYRKFEREGWPIHWIPGGEQASALELVERFLSGRPLPPPRIRLQDIVYGPRSQP